MLLDRHVRDDQRLSDARVRVYLQEVSPAQHRACSPGGATRRNAEADAEVRRPGDGLRAQERGRRARWFEIERIEFDRPTGEVPNLLERVARVRRLAVCGRPGFRSREDVRLRSTSTPSRPRLSTMTFHVEPSRVLDDASATSDETSGRGEEAHPEDEIAHAAVPADARARRSRPRRGTRR